jgi:hypothetical protein
MTYVVITGDGFESEKFTDLAEAIIWAIDTHLAYEVIDLGANRIVWTDYDQDRQISFD